MKRVILDEGVPRQVARHLSSYEVTTVPARGWASVKNGTLLSLIEDAGFDAFITCDKNMEFQQPQLERRPFAILLLSTNHWPTIMPHVSNVASALDESLPGIVTMVDCGRFLPGKIRPRYRPKG